MYCPAATASRPSGRTLGPFVITPRRAVHCRATSRAFSRAQGPQCGCVFRAKPFYILRSCFTQINQHSLLPSNMPSALLSITLKYVFCVLCYIYIEAFLFCLQLTKSQSSFCATSGSGSGRGRGRWVGGWVGCCVIPRYGEGQKGVCRHMSRPLTAGFRRKKSVPKAFRGRCVCACVCVCGGGGGGWMSTDGRLPGGRIHPPDTCIYVCMYSRGRTWAMTVLDSSARLLVTWSRGHGRPT